tara:strand:+ start:123 stop:254 length:132 start_codon:yes stop_codon:yes gene_type:complete
VKVSSLFSLIGAQHNIHVALYLGFAWPTGGFGNIALIFEEKSK